MTIIWFLASPNGCVKFRLSVYSRWCFADPSWSRIFGNSWTTAIQRLFIYKSQLHSSTIRFIWASDDEKICSKNLFFKVTRGIFLHHWKWSLSHNSSFRCNDKSCLSIYILKNIAIFKRIMWNSPTQHYQNINSNIHSVKIVIRLYFNFCVSRWFHCFYS